MKKVKDTNTNWGFLSKETIKQNIDFQKEKNEEEVTNVIEKSQEEYIWQKI